MAVIVAEGRLVRNAYSAFPTAAIDAPIVFDERLFIFHQRQQSVVRVSSEFREVARQFRDRAWLRANPQFEATSPLLPNRNKRAMTRSNVTKRLMLAARATAARIRLLLMK